MSQEARQGQISLLMSDGVTLSEHLQMRYWQITTRRMSKAAKKLDSDGHWHPFATAEHSWYRVWQNRLIQRIQFDSATEESDFITRLEKFEPIPEIATSEGFRDEIVLRWDQQGPTIITLLGYPFSDEELGLLFANVLKQHHIATSIENGLLFSITQLQDLETREITAKQETILAIKLLFEALSRGNPPENALALFERSRRDTKSN